MFMSNTWTVSSFLYFNFPVKGNPRLKAAWDIICASYWKFHSHSVFQPLSLPFFLKDGATLWLAENSLHFSQSFSSTSAPPWRAQVFSLFRDFSFPINLPGNDWRAADNVFLFFPSYLHWLLWYLDCFLSTAFFSDKNRIFILH